MIARIGFNTLASNGNGKYKYRRTHFATPTNKSQCRRLSIDASFISSLTSPTTERTRALTYWNGHL